MPWQLPTLAELESAAALVYRHMPPTPQYNWPLLDETAGTEVWVKHENHTPVGAFKIRGGIVYMDALRRERPEIRGVVGATRGNHGQSMGFAARMTRTDATVIVPNGNSPEKNAAMRALGVHVIAAGRDFQEACEYADALAQDRGLHRLPSLDPRLVCGVGTYALEFLRGAPPLDTVYVPIGMGSGICGMIAVRNALNLLTKIVGVVSSGAPAYKLSFEAGRKIEHDVTTVLGGTAWPMPLPERGLSGDPAHGPGARYGAGARRGRGGRSRRRCASCSRPRTMSRRAQVRRRGCGAAAGARPHARQAGGCRTLRRQRGRGGVRAGACRRLRRRVTPRPRPSLQS